MQTGWFKTASKTIISCLMVAWALGTPSWGDGPDTGTIRRPYLAPHPLNARQESYLNRTPTYLYQNRGLLLRDEKVRFSARVYGERGRLLSAGNDSYKRLQAERSATRSLLSRPNNRLWHPNLRFKPIVNLLQSSTNLARTRLASRGTLLHQASNYFSHAPRRRIATIPANRPYVPSAGSYAKEAANYYVRVLSDKVGAFHYYDKRIGQEWRLRMVTHPHVRKVGTGYVVQVGFRGTVGDDPSVFPVVLEFNMQGKGKHWKVAGVNMVSVNHMALVPKAKEFVVFSDDSIQPMAKDRVGATDKG